MSITQTIPQFTRVPNKLLSPEEFRADADSFFSEIDAYVASINNWSTQANSLRDEVNVFNDNVNAKNANVNQKAIETASNAQIAETAKNTILSYVVPTNATYSPETIDNKDNIQNKFIFVSGGFTTTETKKSDRWLETNTLNTIIDKKSDNVVFSDRIYERNTISSTFTLPEAPFAGSNDELLNDKVNGLVAQKAHNKRGIVVTGAGSQLVAGAVSDKYDFPFGFSNIYNDPVEKDVVDFINNKQIARYYAKNK